MEKSTVLIAEDNKINRDILNSILKSDYYIIKAKNGKETLSKIEEYKDSISVVLLDIMMPKIDGFEILKILKEKKISDIIPVIVTSGDDSINTIAKCFDLGAKDFIPKPYAATIIKKRVENAIIIYENNKRLESSFLNQFNKSHKQVDVLMSILANIVEFRNAETELHTLRIKIITNILLRELMKIAPQYNLTEEIINDISNASSLHDIGKIAIPEEILNKTGKLTESEFKQTQIHPIVGALILDKLSEENKKEPLIRYAYEIARWHHERWTGKGYPDGLEGDDIPISAQVVSIADCFDSLTRDRCYNKAIDYNTAANMILNGECGVFNPLLLIAFKNCMSELIEYLKDPGKYNIFKATKLTELAYNLLNTK